MPCVYMNHGGGPLPLMGRNPEIVNSLINFWSSLKVKPTAIVVITAHWQEANVTVSSADRPSLLYDYGGFPPETYKYKYGAPGNP